jgi:hypothetical protein
MSGGYLGVIGQVELTESSSLSPGTQVFAYVALGCMGLGRVVLGGGSH